MKTPLMEKREEVIANIQRNVLAGKFNVKVGRRKVDGGGSYPLMATMPPSTSAA